METIHGLLFFREVVGIERFTLKPRFLPIRVDAPGGVLRISSDGDDRMGQNHNPKKSLRLPTKPQKKSHPGVSARSRRT